MGSGSRQRFDVLVIGGGPAGLMLPARAAECGVRVGIVDDNFNLADRSGGAGPRKRIPRPHTGRTGAGGETYVSAGCASLISRKQVLLAEGRTMSTTCH